VLIGGNYKAPGRFRPGYSLFELALVLAIIAIVAAIAVPRYADSIARHRADLAARRIVADLDLARSRAYSSSSTVTVKFDVPADVLWVVGITDMDHPGSDHVVKFADPPYHARLLFADFGGSSAVNFDGYGVPDSGGSIIVQVGSFQRTLKLDPSTGKATVQ
jgi:prepilin-type N-terminal cleavage/methylation domain-containing protein